MNLPTIKALKITDLSLYTKPINRQFLPGINMVIGGNGIGKTTLVNTLLFALVGNSEYALLNPKTGKSESVALVETDYFRGRIKPEHEDSAKVTLTLGVEQNEITVTRALFRPRILEFSIRNGKSVKPKVYRTGKLEDLYAKTVRELVGVEQFEDFVFLVSHLLLFDENRRRLVWDEEVQNKAIRLLCTSPEFDRKYDELRDRATRIDTQGRHMSEKRKEINRDIERWLLQKAELTGKNATPSEEERVQTQLRIAEIEKQIDSLTDEIEKIEESLRAETDQIKSLTAEADQLEMQKIPLGEELEDLERTFYSSVYKTVPPPYMLVLEALTKQGTCQICGSKGEHLKKLGRQLKEEGKCLVCRSSIEYAVSGEEEPDKNQLAEKINALRARLEELASEQNVRAIARASAEKASRKVQELIAEKSKARGTLESELFELKSKYLLTTGSNRFGDSEEDKWLDNQHRQVEKLDTDIESLYRKRDKAREALAKLNDQLLDNLNMVNEALTPLFSQFASQFLGTDCKLVVSKRTRPGKPIAFMYPSFNGQDRTSITQVSESQQFFLEQAFRMALITWFARQGQGPTFFIVETPEGSLDLAYERNVARMYLAFGKDEHTVIITSNLNRSGFLQGLYSELGSEKTVEKRTLNLLQYGHLTNVQQQETAAFNREMDQLHLPSLQ